MTVCFAAVAQQKVPFTSQDGTEIFGWLFQPAGQPKGTVVALHGCGGLYSKAANAPSNRFTPRHRAMADMLVGEGYAVLFPDSLTPRGETQICTQRLGARAVDQTHRRADTLAALAWVAQQPWAARERIALLGWSHGGSGVLSSTDLKDAVSKPAVAIAFYPGCGDALKANYRPNTRLVMMLGEKDDWTRPQPCIDLGKRVGAEVNVYPDAYHDFDNPVTPVRLRTDVPRQGGVHTGGNPVAREASYARVREVLKEALR